MMASYVHKDCIFANARNTIISRHMHAMCRHGLGSYSKNIVDNGRGGWRIWQYIQQLIQASITFPTNYVKLYAQTAQRLVHKTLTHIILPNTACYWCRNFL